MYELVCGSIFDKKCDIIIIPCNDRGGITRNVKDDLYLNEILNSPFVHSPGDIVFDESKGNFTNAIVIGFAASVNARTGRSKVEYLHNICNEIKNYCKMNSLSLVNIPLLGAGSGGLSIQESFDVLKSSFENEVSINLRIFAYSREIYSRLDNTEKKKRSARNPRVFISYTGENPENRKWVKNFVCRLRENGVNARVDMYHLKPGQDLPQWMTNELIMADKVLLICDKFYAKKADSRNGGVGWETMIIQGDMMIHSQSNKYICIIREENIDEGIPLYAKTKFSLQWNGPEIADEEFQELLYHLFDIDIEPKLGEIPKDILDRL